MEKMKPQLGALLRLARGSRSMNQISRESGIAVGQISLIEAGKRADPQFSTMIRLSRALNISLDSIAGSLPLTKTTGTPLEHRLQEVENQLRALTLERSSTLTAQKPDLEPRIQAIEQKLGEPSGTYFGPDADQHNKLIEGTVTHFMERTTWALGANELVLGGSDRLATLSELIAFTGMLDPSSEQSLIARVEQLHEALDEVRKAYERHQDELFDLRTKVRRLDEGAGHPPRG